MSVPEVAVEVEGEVEEAAAVVGEVPLRTPEALLNNDLGLKEVGG